MEKMFKTEVNVIKNKLSEEEKRLKDKEEQHKKKLSDLEKKHATDMNSKEIELKNIKKQLADTTEEGERSKENFKLLQSDNKSLIDKMKSLEDDLKDKSNSIETYKGKLRDMESSLEAYKNMKESHDQLSKNLKVQSDKFKTNKKVSETIIMQKDKEIELLKKSLSEATKVSSSVASSSKRKREETDLAIAKKPKSAPRQELSKISEETRPTSESDNDSLISYILDAEEENSTHQSEALDLIDTFTASLTSARAEVEASWTESESRRSLSPVASEPFSESSCPMDDVAKEPR